MKCPAPGCDADIAAQHLACPKHWFGAVPPGLRAQVWATWLARQRHPKDPLRIAAHETAKQVALEAMTSAIARWEERERVR